MESRPTGRLRRSPPPPQHGGGDPDGHDRISALSDDMLLQVLVRLRCARAAARTGLLSRRWRGLWVHLPGLTFRDIPAGHVKLALSRVARRTAVSLLEIHLWRSTSAAAAKLDDAHAKSLLCAAARFLPEEIVFVLPQCPVKKPGRAVTMLLPCFSRVNSIELDTGLLPIMPPPAGELPVLETLSISGSIVDIGALLNRCPRLRMLGITFRAVDPSTIEAELATLEAAATLGLVVSRLGIEYDIYRRHRIDGARFASLLRVAARLSPQELLFTNRFHGNVDDAGLLCFHRATSIEMSLYNLRFRQLPASEFSALERLALNGCTITDLVAMIIRCPRLRVLKVTADRSAHEVTVHSLSLEELELDVQKDTKCRSIHIVTPLVKQLKLHVHGKANIGVSISAPMVETVSWWRTYTTLPLVFDFWWLESMRLETIENYRHRDEEGVCLQLPRADALSMEISSYIPMGFAVDFAHEMEKLLGINFYVVELHLIVKGHAVGASVFPLFRMPHIRTTIQKLKVVLSWWGCQTTQASKGLENYPCDEPKDWRGQSISLTRLEDVEINKFRGGYQEIDFVRLLFGCAPMLGRITIMFACDVKESDIGGCTRTIHNICAAYPSVDCFVYLSTGEKWSCRGGLRQHL